VEEISSHSVIRVVFAGKVEVFTERWCVCCFCNAIIVPSSPNGQACGALILRHSRFRPCRSRAERLTYPWNKSFFNTILATQHRARVDEDHFVGIFAALRTHAGEISVTAD
jgi:hypothetical protein